MAGWRDFISSIDEERKKAGRWVGDRAGDVGNFAGAAGSFLGDVAQSIPRGVVNIGLTLDEAARNDSLDTRNKTIDELKKIDIKQRNKFADMSPEEMDKLSQEDWSKAYIIKKAKKQLGAIDDAALDKRKSENTTERGTHKTYKADNDVAKFFLGGEDDEVAQSAQKTDEDITNWGIEQGMDRKQASALGGVGAIGLTVLDAPTGVGSLVKSPLKAIGKQGIKNLAKEGTEEGAEAILKKALPGVSDDVVKKLAPQLAKETDEKVIRRLITENGKALSTGLRSSAGASKESFKQTAKDFLPSLPRLGGKNATDNAADVAKPLVDDLAESGIDIAEQTAKNAPGAPKTFGEASDRLLGRVKTSTELPKDKKGFRDAFKEQFVDKLSPVNDMIKTIEQRTGKKLATEDNPYELMRLYNGMPDMVQQRVRDLTDILKQAPDLDAVKVIGLGRQVRGRAERGVSSFVSADDASAAIKEVYSRLGAQDFDKAAKVVDAVNAYNKGLLDDLHKAGIISDDALKAINEVGADYFSRFNVIDYIMKSDSNRALFSKTGSYNTTKQTLNKILASAKGMEEGTEILDPIESIVRSTDHTMRAIAKNDIWHAFDRLADEVPDMIVRTREPENVAQRIALSLDNKELRPIRNKLDRMISTRGSWVRRLESQVNQLNKKGLNVSLKKGGERMTSKDFLVEGLGGKVPTSQTGKVAATTARVGDETVQGFMDVVNPQKLGPSDTGAFLRNLIEKGSRSDIDKIKAMIGNRDAKLTQLVDEIGEMKSQFDDIAGTIKTNVDEAKSLKDIDVPAGMAQISGFGKGIQGKLAVPEEIADVFTGKTKSQQDYLTSMISNVNSFVKQNFTSNNPAFALITNPIRDAKTFAYNSKDVKAGPLSIGKALAEGLWARTFGKGELYERWVKAGGKSGFYADERSAEKLAKDLTREISGKRVLGVKMAPVTTTKEFLKEISRIPTAPLRVARDALHGAASILEDTPRLAQFKASVKAGKSDTAAAFNARNVTVDFQQAGRIGQTVNAWVPFLNARFQGTLKSADAIKRNPARAAAVYASLTAAPILLAAANNERFPEVMKMIPDQDRDNNFIIVLGDERDEKGDFTQVIKIPKSDVDKILGNPLDQLARFVAKDDPDSLQEILTNMIGNTLPFDTVRDDQFSVERTVGSVLPPLLKAPVEAVTNRNLYFGSDIVPQSLQDLPANEQVRDSTSLAGQFLGSVTGTSPLKAENTIRNFTGSLLTKAPQDQLGGKLAGASANKMNDEFYKTLNKTSPNRASASKYINESLAKGDYQAAKQAADTYNKYLRESFTPFGQTYGGQMTAELAGIYDEQKIVLTSRSIKQRQRNQLERDAAGKTQ
jgi:hypothetical protein